MSRDYVNEFLRANPPRTRIREPLLCKSGLLVSIQASSAHYCSPKEDAAPTYFSVEVRYPQRDGEEVRLRTLGKYRDGPVYGYAPVDAVNRIIHRNGGPV